MKKLIFIVSMFTLTIGLLVACSDDGKTEAKTVKTTKYVTVEIGEVILKTEDADGYDLLFKYAGSVNGQLIINQVSIRHSKDTEIYYFPNNDSKTFVFPDTNVKFKFDDWNIGEGNVTFKILN